MLNYTHQYRTDNTEGYTAAERDALNAELAERLASLGLDPEEVDDMNDDGTRTADVVETFRHEVATR